MYQIREVSAKAGVPPKTMRYYEQVGLLPPARRAPNGYRIYADADVERLQFIRSARSLDFTLDEIAEILAFRDRGMPPCKYVMNVLRHQIDEIEGRILALQRIKDELKNLYDAGRHMPEDALMRTCVCHLIQASNRQRKVKGFYEQTTD